MGSSALLATIFRPLNLHVLHGMPRVMIDHFPALSLLLLLDVLLLSLLEPLPLPDDAEPPPREDELPLEEPCPEDVRLPLP